MNEASTSRFAKVHAAISRNAYGGPRRNNLASSTTLAPPNTKTAGNENQTSAAATIPTSSARPTNETGRLQPITRNRSTTAAKTSPLYCFTSAECQISLSQKANSAAVASPTGAG